MADKKKVLIIGPSGCGKTSMFIHLTGDSTAKLKETLVSQSAPFRLDDKILVIDTPGLENDDYEWWENVNDFQPVNLVLFMINGTSERVKNLNKIYWIYKSIKGKENNFKVLAIKGTDFNADNTCEIKYEFLKDPKEKYKYAPGNNACTKAVTYSDVDEYLHNISDEQISLFSPFELIQKLDEKNAQIKELQTDLTTLRDQVSDGEKALHHMTEKEKETSSKVNTLEINMQSKEIEYQRKISSLIDFFFKKDQDGNYYSRKESGAFHLISWLPFAGNVVLALKRAEAEKAELKLIQAMSEDERKKVKNIDTPKGEKQPLIPPKPVSQRVEDAEEEDVE